MTREQFRLYDLIWKRLLASQMEDALLDSTTVEVVGQSVKSKTAYNFRANGSVLKFPGFRALYMEDTDDATEDKDSDKDGSDPLPLLNEGDILSCLGLAPEQHFTKPPPRYSEAMLIKALEENGIGRPSTYAPILGTIMDRDYVRKDQGRFVPTKLGIAVYRPADRPLSGYYGYRVSRHVSRRSWTRSPAASARGPQC